MRSLDVVRETGVTYRQLDYWTRCGLITATHLRGVKDPHESEAGCGTQRQYSGSEVSVIKALVSLCKFGMDPRRGAPIARRSVEELIPLHQALTEALQEVAS